MTTTDNQPTTHPAPGKVEQLTTALAALTDLGIRHPGAFLAPEPRVSAALDLITPWERGRPPTDEERYQRAIDAHRIITAAVAAIGGPQATALRHLLDLPDPLHEKERRTTSRGRKGGRRAAAAAALSPDPDTPIAADSFRRRHERSLLRSLALEIWHRTRQAAVATHGPEPGTTATPARPPLSPPPPPEAFRPATPPRPR